MKVLIIGGMHGNEPLGLQVVKLFQAKPVDGVDVLLANELAITQNCRFIDHDLNRCFPGDATSKEYEPKRAAALLKLTKGYDVVLDFHNTYCPDNDCGFVGNTATKRLDDIAWLFGLEKIIVADYDCINKYVPNCLSIEVSLNSPLNQSGLWYERITLLSRLVKFSAKAVIDHYRFVSRITLEARERLRLDKQNLKAFQPLPDQLAKAMDVESPAFPIFIGDGFTPYNYGGLLNKIN